MMVMMLMITTTDADGRTDGYLNTYLVAAAAAAY